MAVAKVFEITSSSTKSFDDAIQTGIARSSKTLDDAQGAGFRRRPWPSRTARSPNTGST